MTDDRAADRAPLAWPLMALRLRIGAVELRLPRDQEIDDLADVAVRGVHPPGRSPFDVDWTALPPRTLRLRAAQEQWRNRGTWGVDDWKLTFAVFADGEVVGCQEISAQRFGVRRRVQTGSWLGSGFQGRGIGTLARIAVLSLAFDRLEAHSAHSNALEDNVASLRVTRRLGYRANGGDVGEREGQRVRFLRFYLTAEDWAARTSGPVCITGFEECRDLFGLAPTSANPPTHRAGQR